MVAGASGVVPPAADGAGEPGGNKVLAWQASSLEASSMLRMCRASGNSVRTEMRGWADDGGVSGRSRSVAARRTSRRRPSGKATAMKAGPRPQVNDSSLSTCPNKGCRGSVTVTLETIRSKLGADRSVRAGEHLSPLRLRVLHPAVWTRGRGYAASLRSDWFQATRAAAGLRYPFLAMSQSAL
jgi:hypothetical protein